MSNTVYGLCLIQNFIQVDLNYFVLLRALFPLCSTLCLCGLSKFLRCCTLFTHVDVWYMYIVWICNYLFTHLTPGEIEYCPLWDCYEQCCYGILACVFWGTYGWISAGWTPRSGISGFHGLFHEHMYSNVHIYWDIYIYIYIYIHIVYVYMTIRMFSHKRYHHTVFQSVYCNSSSHQQCVRPILSPHAPESLAFPMTSPHPWSVSGPRPRCSLLLPSLAPPWGFSEGLPLPWFCCWFLPALVLGTHSQATLGEWLEARSSGPGPAWLPFPP